MALKMNKIETTLQEVFNLLPAKTSFTYVDRNDNLNNNVQELQLCIKDNSFDILQDQIENWSLDEIQNSESNYIKELKNDLQSKLNLTKSESKKIIAEYYDKIIDELYARNTDNTIQDLLNNTTKFILYYDTGYYAESESYNFTETRLLKEMRNVKRALGIKIQNTKYNHAICQMIQQAYYGGQLVIYFRTNISKLISKEEKDFNSITFKNMEVAIINTDNCSGDNCKLQGHEVTFNFNRNNLFIDKINKYNYTYAICCMSENWCDCTSFELSFKKSKKTKVVNSISNSLLDREEAYNKTWKTGACTYGDMDMSRHKNKPYINEYPCGNRCTTCGTFWID